MKHLFHASNQQRSALMIAGPGALNTGSRGFGWVAMSPKRTWAALWRLGIAALLLNLVTSAQAQLTQTYNTTGTFVVPAGVTEVTVECWGGGGRGGSRTTNGRGGGGGGGAYARSVIPVIEGNTYTVTVGAGSTGTGAGGDSWFGTATTVMAKGGSSCGNNSSSGANGGSASASIGTVKFAGGDGANAPGSTGGGGGSSAGTAAAGADGSGQNGGNAPSGGGDGGNGGNGTFTSGNSGSTPGGGGGGAERGCCIDVSGGAGASGRVVLTYTPCTGPTVVVSPSAPSVCPGASVQLTASGASGSYTWSPSSGLSSTSGAVVTATPTTTTTYTVTGLNTGCSIEGSTSVTVSVTPGGPTVVGATATETVVCAGGTTALAASGSGAGTILANDFNSGVGSWTVSNSLTTGGTSTNRANVNWTIRPNNYFYNATSGADPTFNSNDNSSFFLANSDAGTSAVTTNTVLRSPSFSTVGYTGTSLSFYHHYRYNSGSEAGRVEVSTDNTNWTAAATYNSTIGAVNGFQLATVDLSAYDGEPTVWIRFRYSATFDWWWALDNVSITGTSSAALSWAWTSTPSGFTSSAKDPGTITVDQTRTYLVTATAQNGCSTSSSVTVTAVEAPDAGTNSTLTTCSNSAATSLLSTLGGTPDAGGSWSGPSAVVGDLYDPATMDPGTYTYTVSAPPCANATATVVVTENTATAWYADSDGDGFGDAGTMVMACTAPSGYVSNSSDCDDDAILYTDGDGDGFGTGSPVPCGVANNTDCNDSQILHADMDGDGFGAAANAPCGIADGSDCDDSQSLYADGDGDGFGAGSPVACGVANNADCNDGELQYADADGDGFGAGSPVACGVSNNTDDCPTVPGLIGSTCDAQPGPGFVLGQLNGSCACVATPCTENVVLELRSDANSSQLGWEILAQNTNLVICSGGAPAEPFPNGITSPIAPNCCLPIGCYRLRVLDAGGDGFVSGGITGGYQLRESGPAGRRIIDNMGNFTGGASSALASTYDNGAFCVPVGTDRPIFSSCDKQDWVNNKFIVATENPAVSAHHGVNNANSGYEFWFFDPNGSYSFRRFRSHATSDGYGSGATRACHFKINGWYNTIATPHIPTDVVLNVRIRGRVNGTNLPFGAACVFRIDPVRAACPLVKLQDNPLNTSDFSCGVTRVFGGSNSSANKLVANPPQFTPTVASNMVRYQFRFRIPGEYPNPGSCIVRPPQMSPALHLNWTSGDKLKCNTQYEVDVRVSKDGGATWCVADGEPTCSSNPTIWGKVCMVNISTSTFCPSSAQGGSSAFMPGTESNFTMYPNPNNGEQLFLSLTALEQSVAAVKVDIFDMTGKRVLDRAISTQDGLLNSTLELNSLQSGVYLVNVTAGTRTHTERLIIQR